MTTEHDRRQLPDWARRERERDFQWIGENLYIFVPAAAKGYQEVGRGALVVNTLERPNEEGHPFAYFPQAVVDTGDNEDLKRMVREYDPTAEFVVMLVKPEQHTSTYRLQTRSRTHSLPFSPS